MFKIYTNLSGEGNVEALQAFLYLELGELLGQNACNRVFNIPYICLEIFLTIFFAQATDGCMENEKHDYPLSSLPR